MGVRERGAVGWRQRARGWPGAVGVAWLALMMSGGVVRAVVLVAMQVATQAVIRAVLRCASGPGGGHRPRGCVRWCVRCCARWCAAGGRLKVRGAVLLVRATPSVGLAAPGPTGRASGWPAARPCGGAHRRALVRGGDRMSVRIRVRMCGRTRDQQGALRGVRVAARMHARMDVHQGVPAAGPGPAVTGPGPSALRLAWRAGRVVGRTGRPWRQPVRARLGVRGVAWPRAARVRPGLRPAWGGGARRSLHRARGGGHCGVGPGRRGSWV